MVYLMQVSDYSTSMTDLCIPWVVHVNDMPVQGLRETSKLADIYTESLSTAFAKRLRNTVSSNCGLINIHNCTRLAPLLIIEFFSFIISWVTSITDCCTIFVGVSLPFYPVCLLDYNDVLYSVLGEVKDNQLIDQSIFVFRRMANYLFLEGWPKYPHVTSEF